jgi:hypothetical protein
MLECHQPPVPGDPSGRPSNLCTQNLLAGIILHLLNAVLLDYLNYHALEVNR